MDSLSHQCGECSRSPDETKFRLNGSGELRKYCEECSKKRHRRLRGASDAPVDDTPRVADGYAMMPYQGAVIAWDTDGGMVCLTDLWRAAGSPENKDPAQWLRLPSTQEYIEACARRGIGMCGTHTENVYSRKGGAGGGGTWREKIVGLAYAQNLNADLYVACNLFTLEKWGQAQRGGIVSDELLRAIAEKLGVLPRMEAKIDGLRGTADDIRDRIVNEPERWVGQNYIIEIKDPHMLALLWRKFIVHPEDKPCLIAVGRTGPSGDVYELRLKDLLGKIDLELADYAILAHFGSPCPEDTEMHVLNYPLAGCERLRLKNGKPSLTFIAADFQGVQKYIELGCGKYHTLQSLERALPKPIIPLSPQMDFRDLFGD